MAGWNDVLEEVGKTPGQTDYVRHKWKTYGFEY